MVEYPPYVNSYGQLEALFSAIKIAAVPTKFTNDFLSTVLNLKSSSFRAMIPFLKKLGFLDQANQPTQAYKDLRDETQSRYVMGRQIKEGYSTLYTAHEYAHRLTKPQLTSKILTLTGAGEDDKIIPSVVGTFLELCKNADFETTNAPQKPESEKQSLPKLFDQYSKSDSVSKIGLSYTINLNLPATTEIEVFNAIFKSLKEHILDD